MPTDPLHRAVIAGLAAAVCALVFFAAQGSETTNEGVPQIAGLGMLAFGAIAIVLAIRGFAAREDR